MTVLLICLLIMMLLPYIAKLPLAKAMSQLGTYDNNHPRAQQAQLEGYGARTLAAHQNSFEALIVFSVAVLTALVTNHIAYWVQVVALVYVISRVVYHVLYLKNLASLRSLTWMVGYLCCLAIFIQCFF